MEDDPEGDVALGARLRHYLHSPCRCAGLPSGCGKSTLLRTLNRMYSLYPGQRATGQILFNGENLLDASVDLNMLRAKVGMVFQKPTPFPMSIYENVAFGIRLYENVSQREM